MMVLGTVTVFGTFLHDVVNLSRGWCCKLRSTQAATPPSPSTSPSPAGPYLLLVLQIFPSHFTSVVPLAWPLRKHSLGGCRSEIRRGFASWLGFGSWETGFEFERRGLVCFALRCSGSSYGNGVGGF